MLAPARCHGRRLRLSHPSPHPDGWRQVIHSNSRQFLT
ncbi:hypothetical protein TI01_1193 [Lysobacter sp. A03]|nr:hypothetical protein TI01_1193 [Lysobacter sp. A03]